MDHDSQRGGVEETPEQKDKMQTLKHQVDEVIDIMKQNVEQVVARGENASHLEDKSKELEQGAKEFKHSSIEVNRAYRCKYVTLVLFMLVTIILIVVVIVLLAIGVIPVRATNSTTEP